MRKVFLYNHGGSENHGCEALVRTVCSILDEKPQLYSEAPQQDKKYHIQDIATIKSALEDYSKVSLDFLSAYLKLKVKKDYFQMDVLPYRKTIEDLKGDEIEISIGGDIYCYEYYPKFIELHKLISNKGCKSILLGCSLEESLFSDPQFVDDMKRYDYISARESITYDMLRNAGFTHIGLHPDSAFTLGVEELPLPKGFIEGNTVGINVSPLVLRKEKSDGIVMDNFKRLIDYILKHTSYAVALIPHVIWESNDDRTVLKELYDMFKESDRVCMIEDHNCMQLKGYISRCRFFIGARTHATIAAYSTCVPTLVLGYSTKSKGIARDLFGSYEHYVLPVEQLSAEEDLLDAFRWINDHENEIRNHLKKIMPDYVQKAKVVKNSIRKVLED